jgi:chromosome segregation ATPase
MPATGRTLIMASPTSLLEQLPDWMKVLGGTIGGGGFVAFLKYLSDRRGYEVKTEISDDEKTVQLVSALTEKLLAPMKEVFLSEQANLREEIKDLKTDIKTMTANYLATEAKYVELRGIHATCEAQIKVLTGKVHDLVDTQTKAEKRAEKREQDLKEELLTARMVADGMHQTMQTEHLRQQVERNTEILKEKGQDNG